MDCRRQVFVCHAFDLNADVLYAAQGNSLPFTEG